VLFWSDATASRSPAVESQILRQLYYAVHASTYQ